MRIASNFTLSYVSKRPERMFTQKRVRQCSQQHYAYQEDSRNTPDVHQLMDG